VLVLAVERVVLLGQVVVQWLHLVELVVTAMEDASQETPYSGASRVRIQVMSQVPVWVVEHRDGEQPVAKGDGRVEACTRMSSGSLDASVESQHDTESFQDSVLVVSHTSSTKILHDEDNRYEHKSQHHLGVCLLDIIAETFSIHAVGLASSWVSRGNNTKHTWINSSLKVFKDNPGESSSRNGANKLKHDDHDHKKGIFSILSPRSVNSNSDCRVEVTACDCSENNDGSEESKDYCEHVTS
jgi:hypothetical protein